MTLHVDSFVQARHYRPGRTKPLRLIVIHATQGGETAASAEGVQAMFARGDRVASAHVSIDTNTVAGSVHPQDTAFAAAGANSDGYHIELCGRSEQTAAQWDDDASRKVIGNGAKHAGEASAAFGIPLVWLSPAQVAGTGRGLCTHHDVSLAFPAVSTGHWDPGPNFPKQRFLELAFGVVPIPDLTEDDVAKWTYVQDDTGKIFLASPGLPPYQVMGTFDDAEHLVKLAGGFLNAPPVDAVDLGADTSGEFRKGLKLNKTTDENARRWFGV